jgi:tripartite-type tricarboxylate transporter receptor subunit TctC
MAGRVPVIFVDLFTLMPHVKTGSLRVLAVTGAKRAAIAPSVPTAIEQGVKGLEITAWLGLFAPAGTPDGIVESLHRGVVTVARRDDFIKRMADSGAEIVASSPAQFSDFFQREIALYRKVAATANIHLE